MNDREYVLLIDDDRAVTEGLALLMEHPGRTTIVCSDIESAELMLTRYTVSSILTDVQFSGTFGFEGLHLLERIRSLHECPIVLMTGNANPELRTAAKQGGAASVLAKPFTYHELTAALPPMSTNDEPYEVLIVPTLDDILTGGLLTTAFQPIVCAGPEGVRTYGFEALSRVRGGWPGGGPAELFDYAESRGRLAELNMAALVCAIHDAAQLPASAALFINIDPIVFHRADFQPTLRAAVAAIGLSLSRLVLEVTERSGFGDEARELTVFEELRADGVRFALDDHGSAFSHLSSMDVIRPSFIKISQMFGTGFEEDPTRATIVHHVAALAREFGCRPVLEGIETFSTAVAAAAQGIELLQGYHFGRPAPLPAA